MSNQKFLLYFIQHLCINTYTSETIILGLHVGNDFPDIKKRMLACNYSPAGVEDGGNDGNSSMPVPMKYVPMEP